MREDEKAIVRGMVRVALYHKLPKNEWMAKVVPGVEERYGVPLTEEIVDKIHQAFQVEMPPEMAIEEVWDSINPDRPSIREQIAEALTIYSGRFNEDEAMLGRADIFLSGFETDRGRPPNDYLEIEEWVAAHPEFGKLKTG